MSGSVPFSRRCNDLDTMSSAANGLAVQPSRTRTVCRRSHAPELLARMLDALDANGWLADIDGILSRDTCRPKSNVAFAASAIKRIQAIVAAGAVSVRSCDRDDPKGVYIALESRARDRDTLLPLADIATRTASNWAWLTDADVSNVATAIVAAAQTGIAAVVATSIPEHDAPCTPRCVRVDRAIGARGAPTCNVPNGTGDLLAGLYLSATLAEPRIDALATTAGAIQALIDVSLGRKSCASLRG